RRAGKKLLGRGGCARGVGGAEVGVRSTQYSVRSRDGGADRKGIRDTALGTRSVPSVLGTGYWVLSTGCAPRNNRRGRRNPPDWQAICTPFSLERRPFSRATERVRNEQPTHQGVFPCRGPLDRPAAPSGPPSKPWKHATCSPPSNTLPPCTQTCCTAR